ncbi:MAG: archease [Desulfosudaceae bacterium]
MTATPPYRHFEHTADLGLEIFGATVEELFVNASRALFDTIAVAAGRTGRQQSDISVSGADLPDLLVNWLRELLALWTVNGRLMAAVEILFLTETELRARLHWDTFDPDHHLLGTEIKAVTYHGLIVEKTDRGWRGRVVLDV